MIFKIKTAKSRHDSTEEYNNILSSLGIEKKGKLNPYSGYTDGIVSIDSLEELTELSERLGVSLIVENGIIVINDDYID